MGTLNLLRCGREIRSGTTYCLLTELLFAIFFFLGRVSCSDLNMKIPPLQNEQARNAAGWDSPGGLAAVCPRPNKGTWTPCTFSFCPWEGWGKTERRKGPPLEVFLHTLGTLGRKLGGAGPVIWVLWSSSDLSFSPFHNLSDGNDSIAFKEKSFVLPHVGILVPRRRGLLYGVYSSSIFNLPYSLKCLLWFNWSIEGYKNIKNSTIKKTTTGRNVFDWVCKTQFPLDHYLAVWPWQLTEHLGPWFQGWGADRNPSSSEC